MDKIYQTVHKSHNNNKKRVKKDNPKLHNLDVQNITSGIGKNNNGNNFKHVIHNPKKKNIYTGKVNIQKKNRLIRKENNVISYDNNQHIQNINVSCISHDNNKIRYNIPKKGSIFHQLIENPYIEKKEQQSINIVRREDNSKVLKNNIKILSSYPKGKEDNSRVLLTYPRTKEDYIDQSFPIRQENYAKDQSNTQSKMQPNVPSHLKYSDETIIHEYIVHNRAELLKKEPSLYQLSTVVTEDNNDNQNDQVPKINHIKHDSKKIKHNIPKKDSICYSESTLSHKCSIGDISNTSEKVQKTCIDDQLQQTYKINHIKHDELKIKRKILKKDSVYHQFDDEPYSNDPINCNQKLRSIVSEIRYRETKDKKLEDDNIEDKNFSQIVHKNDKPKVIHKKRNQNICF